MITIKCETGHDVIASEDTLEGADLSGRNLHRALLGRANLKGARLARCDLRGAWLEDADLTDADLSDTAPHDRLPRARPTASSQSTWSGSDGSRSHRCKSCCRGPLWCRRRHACPQRRPAAPCGLALHPFGFGQSEGGRGVTFHPLARWVRSIEHGVTMAADGQKGRRRIGADARRAPPPAGLPWGVWGERRRSPHRASPPGGRTSGKCEGRDLNRQIRRRLASPCVAKRGGRRRRKTTKGDVGFRLCRRRRTPSRLPSRSPSAAPPRPDASMW